MIWYDMIYDMTYDMKYDMKYDMIYDIKYEMKWYIIFDIWYLILDIWYMTHEKWHAIHDIWYMTHEIWYDMIYLHYIRAYVRVCVSIQNVFTFHESTGPDGQCQGVSIVTAPHSNCFDTLCAQTTPTPQWLLPIWIFQRSWNEVCSPNFQSLQKQRQIILVFSGQWRNTLHLI